MAKYRLAEGEGLEAKTRRGAIKAKALVTERVKPGVVFIPLHFVENAANRLTNSTQASLDPATKTP